MCFPNKRLSSLVAFISALIVGQQAFSQSAIPEEKCAIITGATKDPEVALKAIEKFKDYVPVVIESTNGYLAPSIGIYYKDGSKELVEDFKKDKIIPDDSYCGNADRFVSVLYPNQNFTALTTNPPSLIAQYGYVGKWSADPNDCSITEYETDSIYFDENSVTFATKSCDVKDQQVSPVNSLGLIIEMSCFEEGEQYDDVLSLILQAEDKILIPDTDLEYTKCAQLDESPIVATENRLAELEELEERELAVLDEDAQLKNLEIRLETLQKDLEQRSKDIAKRLAELDKRELALREKEATLEKLGIRLETTQKDPGEKSKDVDDQASFTQNQEYMDYENFLFDVETMLGSNVQVQVPVYLLDVPTRTIQVDLENLKIDVSQIDKKILKDINALCNLTGANCYLNVDGILVRNPEMFPTYSISANYANLMFLVGVAVSEEGLVYVDIDEQSAVNNIIQTTGGTQSYISGYDFIDSTGTFAVAHAIGIFEFYAGWGFNPDQDLAIKKAVESCKKQITGLVNFAAKCEPIVFDVPWW